MAQGPNAPRAWRAACPSCGAPVDFASAASASAVCSFCRSTLVRDGEALRRVGQVGELFDDHSPLQLGAAGRHQGLAFTLVGRLQYGYEGGSWNEWHALFDNGRSGWLSEDNGAYVFAFDAELPAEALPAPLEWAVGLRYSVAGRSWDVASLTQAKLLAAQGELPRPPHLLGSFLVVDLRNAAGEVGTLDYAEPGKPQWSVGRSVALSSLALQGLRGGSEKTLAGKVLPCPNCGSPLDVHLASTQTVACGQCHSVVDVSAGLGVDMAHFRQAQEPPSGVRAELPLGRTGTLALGSEQKLPWQIVGFMERCTEALGDEDEQYFWREYLLHHATEGFAFLVDSDEGWSWAKPITGAPQQRGSQALWGGDTFVRKESYGAKTTWVAGEFYWRVKAGERVRVGDFAGVGPASAKRLSREQTDSEVTWSLGATLPASAVAEAFHVPQPGRGAGPASARLGDAAAAVQGGLVRPLLIFLALVLLIVLLSRCARDDCSKVRVTYGEHSVEYRDCGVRLRGGSWGGGSSGGHK